MKQTIIFEPQSLKKIQLIVLNKVIHKLKKGLVIVNIYESILNRNTRIHYSSLQKG